MLLPFCLTAAFVITVTALPQPADDLFQDSIVDVDVGGSVSLNNDDLSYQNNDFDRPIDESIFEILNDSSELGQSKSLPLIDNSTPRLGANEFAGSIVRSFAAPQEVDTQFEFDDTEMQQEYQVEQPDGKGTMFSDGFLPFPPTLVPPFIQTLEPSCPAGKKAFCCSGGKAADDIGKGCGEWSRDNWLCLIKYFTLCCKGFVKGSDTDAEECVYAPD